MVFQVSFQTIQHINNNITLECKKNHLVDFDFVCFFIVICGQYTFLLNYCIQFKNYFLCFQVIFSQSSDTLDHQHSVVSSGEETSLPDAGSSKCFILGWNVIKNRVITEKEQGFHYNERNPPTPYLLRQSSLEDFIIIWLLFYCVVKFCYYMLVICNKTNYRNHCEK